MGTLSPLARALSRLAFPLRAERISRVVTAQSPQVAVDLGCGDSPRNLFGVPQIFGVDLAGGGTDDVLVADLSREPIPFGDGEVQVVTAFDFLEHIPRWERTPAGIRFPFLDLIDEVHRVLEPGGLFYAETPAFPAREAFQDPTHVNILTPQSFSHYLAGPRWARIYGLKASFTLLSMSWRSGHLITLMQSTRGHG